VELLSDDRFTRGVTKNCFSHGDLQGYDKLFSMVSVSLLREKKMLGEGNGHPSVVQNQGTYARVQGPLRHILMLKYEFQVQCIRHDDRCVMYLCWERVTHYGRAILEAGEALPKD